MGGFSGKTAGVKRFILKGKGEGELSELQL